MQVLSSSCKSCQLEPCQFPSLQDSAVDLSVEKDFWGGKYKIQSISGSLPFSHIREENLLQLVLWEMVHFALFK
jgi:hypothetical protein